MRTACSPSFLDSKKIDLMEAKGRLVVSRAWGNEDRMEKREQVLSSNQTGGSSFGVPQQCIIDDNACMNAYMHIYRCIYLYVYV